MILKKLWNVQIKRFYIVSIVLISITIGHIHHNLAPVCWLVILGICAMLTAAFQTLTGKKTEKENFFFDHIFDNQPIFNGWENIFFVRIPVVGFIISSFVLINLNTNPETDNWLVIEQQGKVRNILIPHRIEFDFLIPFVDKVSSYQKDQTLFEPCFAQTNDHVKVKSFTYIEMEIKTANRLYQAHRLYKNSENLKQGVKKEVCGNYSDFIRTLSSDQIPPELGIERAIYQKINLKKFGLGYKNNGVFSIGTPDLLPVN